ncbi:MAG: LPS export ABC transporter periplasmic protein LptC [Legionellales bacterium]|nr:LPS export ABC transporter periplasmic protein LptC [Legionellales bacterium]
MSPWIIKSSALLVACLMLMSFYLLTKPKTDYILSEAQLATRPDSIIEQMHVTEFSEQGKPMHILITPRLTHYSKIDRSDLQHPKVTILQKDQAPWEIQALSGQTDYGIAQITLHDDVQLRQAADDQRPATTITTSRLVYYPAIQVAQTDQPIEFRQGGVQVKSVGMIADLEQDVVELLQDAWGRFDAHSPNS